MTDKTITLDAMVGAIPAGASVAFGGGGLQRKPMRAARAIAASGAGEYDLVALLGGPETDLLIGAGKVRRLSFAYVGFDAMGLAPNFRSAREGGRLDVVEYSEATMLAALEAGAKRLPFIPTRFGLGTDILNTPTAPFRTVACPFTGEALLAVPALNPDVAVLHVNLADRQGNAVIRGDSFVDALLARASARTYVTAERVVDALPRDLPARSTLLSRLWVDGVVEAPRGGEMTAVYPDYFYDMPAVRAYQAGAADPEWLSAFAKGD